MSDFFMQRSLDDGSEISDLLGDFCREFHFCNASYIGCGFPWGDEGQVSFSTYDKEWIREYDENGYASSDPLMFMSKDRILPLDWSSVENFSPDSKKVYRAARRFGIKPVGMAVPVRGAMSDKALVSFNADMSPKRWAALRPSLTADLIYASQILHQAVYDRLRLQNSAQAAKLTNRETDVLLWAARGKTAWETARILSLSDQTVSFYIKNACVKLRSKSKAQAVANAIASNMIRP